MDHQAHGLRLDHAIFNTPLKAEFSYVDGVIGEHHRAKKSVLYPNGIGEKLRLTKFEKEKGYWNPTLVNHAGFFTDVPGFENLAEGHSAKVLGSLALARQGSYFYWGYSIDPDRLTEPASKTLINTIHYMAQHRGAPTVQFACKPRQTLQNLFDLNTRKPDYKRGIEEHFANSLTPEWRETYTPTRKGCEEWLAKYLPYVFSGRSPEHRGTRYKSIYEVDSDAMALGTPNSTRDSLETWIALSTADDAEKAKQAKRCLRRYVHEDIAPADDNWTSWYSAHKARILFIESTGFWWQTDPRTLKFN